MSQQFTTPCGRSRVRRLSGYVTVLAFLVLTLVAPSAFAQCKVVYTISPQNTSAFGATISIQNTGSTTLSNWSLTWSFANGQTIGSSWNGAETQSGANVTMSEQAGETWENIPAGGSYTGFGFNGTWNGVTNAIPTNFAVNGTACNSSLTATTTALSASSTTTTTGTSITLTATVAPSAATGTVTFLDGTTSLGTGTLSSGKATLSTSFSTAGTHSITAVYGGSTTYATSTSSAVAITVSAGTKTATTTALAVSTTTPAVGASVTLTATVSPSAATGTVTFFSGTTSLGTGTLSSGVATLTTSFATAGTDSLTAVYAGSTTDATSTSSAVSITVGTATKTATTTTLAASTTTPTVGTSVTLTATVSPSAATGTVTFLSGTTSLGTGTLSSGKATLTTSFATAGTDSLTAAYGGSTTDATSTSSSVSITVSTATKTATTTALAASTTTPTVGTSVTLTATVSPSAATGTVTFLSGTTSLGTGTLSSGVATLTTSFATAGTDSLTAAYGGSTTDATSTSSAVSITVEASSANAVVTVNPSHDGIAVSDMILGMNLASWYDISDSGNGPAVVDAFQAAGIKAVRWPGGSWSDIYHWATNTNCFSSTDGAPVANNTFANFVNDLAIPGGLDVSLTADYGTDAACTGGGDPTEAAAWAANALALNANVSHFTVGNEEYGSWEEDLHPAKNDPTTYANAVATGYYPDIKAASPNVLVGVVVNPGNSPAWDPIVLADAKYDFVEYHYYPETPGAENDTTLIQQDAQNLTTSINTIKSELASAGHSGTPIYVGEIGGPYSNPGKQSWSITQGLYAGQVLGEMMNDGVTRLTWWIGFGNCNGQSGNDSSSLYGWQNFGAYNVFSDGPSDPTCPTGSTAPNWGAIGTMSPTARAFQLFSSVAVNGEFVLTPTVTGDTTDVVAYAATHSGGTALVLFNRNETTSETVELALTGVASSSSVTVETYNKALYDQTDSTSPVWAAPTTTSLGAQTLPLTLTLTPWSMNVVTIK
jgi:hypothetical protein